jgi:hypothetical protein
MGQVWVNGKFITSENKKSENWKPAAKQEAKVWGQCPDCGCDILCGGTVWWMINKKVCWECREPYMEAGIGHCDCPDLELPEFSLEG